VLALTGLRVGELLALRWGNVDVDARLLRVCQTVYEGHFDTPRRSEAPVSFRSVPRQQVFLLRSGPTRQTE